MATPEQRALETLKACARDVEALTSGPYHDSPEPQGLSVLEAKARLTLSAKAWARAEREGKRSAKVYESSAPKDGASSPEGGTS